MTLEFETTKDDVGESAARTIEEKEVELKGRRREMGGASVDEGAGLRTSSANGTSDELEEGSR